MIRIILPLVLLALASLPVAADTQVTWADNSDNENGFTIERRLFQTEQFTPIGQVGANVTSYQDTTPLSGETYCYQVGSFNGAGTSYSEQFCFTLPTKPSPDPEPDPIKTKGWGKGGKPKGNTK